MVKCFNCEKHTQFGQNKSHSQKRTRRTFKPNLQKVKVMDNGVLVSRVLCTKCIKAMSKLG